ncbi:MAG: riboflavin synthase [Actinomycetes bacterium]|jgi:riboflavin synthase|nr:MAG: riboflavin synthase [Actinomycetota bacterium]
MFTGIVEATGEVVASGEGRLVVDSPLLAGSAIGASISVSGVCLTVVDNDGGRAAFDVVPETLDRTTLGGLRPGDRVNLERAMPAHGRFDGHIVQGHVDGVGVVVSLDREDERVTLTIEPPPRLMPHIAEKGSIAIDGVSLTVAGVGEATLSVALIPHTLEITTLGRLAVGDRANLETDVIAKYVERILEARR